MDAESSDEKVAMDTPKVLPDQLLSESYSASETVTMTTVDNEQYTCLLPDLSGERTHRVRRASGRLLSDAVHVWQLQVVSQWEVAKRCSTCVEVASSKRTLFHL